MAHRASHFASSTAAVCGANINLREPRRGAHNFTWHVELRDDLAAGGGALERADTVPGC
jgi:hypothetical protein